MPRFVSASGGALGSDATVVIYSESADLHYKITYDYNGKTYRVDWKPSYVGNYQAKVHLEYEIANSIPNARSTTITLRLTAHYTGNVTDADQVGGAVYQNITVTVPDNGSTKPTILSVSKSPSPDTLNGLYVQLINGIRVGSISARGRYGAAIQKTYFRAEGAQYDTVSEAFQQNGSTTVTCYAVDSRGITSEGYPIRIDVLPYFKPKIKPVPGQGAVVVQRCLQDGTLNTKGQYLNIKARREYAPVTYDGIQRNHCSLSYRYRPAEGSWSGWAVILSEKAAGDSVTTGPILGTLDKEKNYEVEIKASDTLGGEVVTAQSVESDLIYWHRDGARGSFCFGGMVTKDMSFEIGAGRSLDVMGNLNLGEVAKQVICDLIYPVGSYYMSKNSTSPASLFGGSWARVKDKFLLAAGDSYAPGTTGGEASHKLTVSEMPSHKHSMYSSSSQYNLRTSAVVPYGGETDCWPVPHFMNGDYDGHIRPAGGGAAHNNMPPYVAVYIWERIE